MNDLEMKAHFIALEWMKKKVSEPSKVPPTPETYANFYNDGYNRSLKELVRLSNKPDYPYPIQR